MIYTYTYVYTQINVGIYTHTRILRDPIPKCLIYYKYIYIYTCRHIYSYQKDEMPHFLITHILYLYIYIDVGIFTHTKLVRHSIIHKLYMQITRIYIYYIYTRTYTIVWVYILLPYTRHPVLRVRIYYMHNIYVGMCTPTKRWDVAYPVIIHMHIHTCRYISSY